MKLIICLARLSVREPIPSRILTQFLGVVLSVSTMMGIKLGQLIQPVFSDYPSACFWAAVSVVLTLILLTLEVRRSLK